LQVNSRKIHDEVNVLEGLMGQQLFLAVLGLEAALQVMGQQPFMDGSTVAWAQAL
jgi:hypothetical protein